MNRSAGWYVEMAVIIVACSLVGLGVGGVLAEALK